ncbi:maleylpyruvate isomerase N-terminal domain-containing protein [Mucilaginibacter sp. ZT4R22]|uniref:Maleylpyruvate isomerase N-terminal domain-containing protein n=1 Tax=Mucilaginibacter pankratovii TaxID=2772110 RepID=A0ABR7X052_9SPHI|nr:maleylpyruvate isomerase N-terminal domain-containing protein [Mucilaginibacter pankratovii]MBD1367312.1 maleylpyruvate isomerase N-terminal domain-containing protein [Mucilaginibacter pankratovii]
MEQVIPVQTLHLFPVLDKLLVELLASLSPHDWHKPTVAKLWNVKDIAAHLLDGNVRAIAALNGYQNNEAPPQINSYQDLVSFLNELNAVWVKAMKRVSPALITQQLESTGKQYVEYLHTLDPFAPAMFSVAWAGEDTSLNWFHIAREYTEKWHHQQQIRDAVGKPGLITRELFYPVIDTFMYALPHTYRNTPAKEGTVIKFTITSDVGGDWFLKRSPNKWELMKGLSPEKVDASVTLDPDTAWKLFTKAISPETALAASATTGDIILANPIFNMVAVMA